MKDRIRDISNADHYQWGSGCDGWHLVKSESLSVIKERMPKNSAENYHYHEKAQQFFYILSGDAKFEIEGEIILVGPHQGIHIKPKEKHRIWNNGNSVLEFLVISEPKSHGDRINL